MKVLVDMFNQNPSKVKSLCKISICSPTRPYHSPRCSVQLPKAAPDSERRCLGQPRRLKQPGMEILIDSQLYQKLILLPSGYVKIAIEHGHIKFVTFPICQWWIFPSFFCYRLPEGLSCHWLQIPSSKLT